MAVGTGNIWRFPRILAQNGGGALIITWLVFLFAWSIPLLILEFGLGRGARQGCVGAISHFAGKNRYIGSFETCAKAILAVEVTRKYVEDKHATKKKVLREFHWWCKADKQSWTEAKMTALATVDSAAKYL